MRLVLLTLLLVGLPTVAHAVAAIPAFMTLAGATATAVAVATVVIAVGSAVYGSAKQRSMKRKAKRKYNASLQDQTVTVIATDSPIRYVYGRTRVGSTIVAMFVSGNRDQYQHMVCVHADHECDAIEEVWVAGKKISNNRDAQGWVLDGEFCTSRTLTNTVTLPTSATSTTLPHDPTSGSVSAVITYGDGQDPVPITVDGRNITITQSYAGQSGNIVIGYTYTETSGRVRVTSHLGYPDEPADSYLISASAGKWTSSHRLRGKCYSVVTVDLQEPEFQSGPPSVEVVLRGAKLYDYRTGTTAWSQNPALATYHYLTSEMCGIPAGDLPLADWIAAANVCDESFDFGARYTVNGSVTSDQAQSDVLEQFADSMTGTIVATTWSIAAGKYVAPVLALTKDDIVGPWSISPGVAEGELANGVRGQFFSAEAGYVATDFRPYQNPAFVASDGRELWVDRTFMFTDTVWRVHNLCRIELEEQRNGLTFKAQFSLKAWDLKVSSRVTLTHELFGWNAKVFIVLDKRYVPVAGAVELTLKEDGPEIWDFTSEVVPDVTPNTGLPDPFFIPKLASLSWTSGTADLLLNTDGTVITRIHATWPAVQTRTGVVELEWQKVGTSAWHRVQVGLDETDAYLAPAQDGAFYTVRGCVFDPAMNRRSDWVYAPVAKVVGKTEPPPAVDRFKVIEQPGGMRQYFWDMLVPPPDLFAFEVRYALGTQQLPWDQMVPLFAKDRNARVHETREPLNSDVYTFAIAAIDSTGNFSSLRYVTEVLDGDVFGSVARISMPHEQGWPGTKTDCMVSGNTLVDTGTLTWNDLDIEWGAHDGLWTNNNASPIVYEHTVQDFGSVAARRVRVNSLAAGVVTIELSTSNDGVTYLAWAAVPSSPVTARYYKLRWSVSGATPVLYRAQAIFYV